MSVRTSLLLMILLLVVAGYVALSQLRPTPPSDIGHSAPWVYALSEQDIRGVTVGYLDQQQAFLRGREGWYFGGTYQVPVDYERWSGIPLLLAGPQSRRLLFKEEEDVSAYGLDNPPGWVQVLLTGDRGFQILLGNKTEDGVSHYVQLSGSPSVYLVDSTWGDVLISLVTDRPYPTWYFQAEAYLVNKLEVSQEGATVSFVNDRRWGWQFNTSDRASERVQVDQERWQEEVVPLLSGPLVQYQVAPQVEDLSSYGLDEPFGIIHIEYRVFNSSGVGVIHDLVWHLGNKMEDGSTYYAKLSRFPVLVGLDAQWVDRILAISHDHTPQ